MKQTFLMITLAALASGCMSTSGASSPTHRWESTTAADEVQYRNDHARCQAQANTSGSNGTFDADSTAFAAYKQCMTNRGYELTAYAGHE